MSITFGGLASGLDTNSIISELMSLEKRPLTRMETDKSYLTNRLKAFSDFESKLKAFQSKLEDLDTTKEVFSFAAKTSSEEFFSISDTSSAVPGSFQVEVENLAQQQKDVSQGYASKSDASFGTGTITINGVDIAYDGDSLSTLMDKINAANSGDTATGVSASIINDGVTGYRMVLTGDDSSQTFTASVNETVAGTYAAPTFSNTQTAQQASILVDGIQIKSNTNTFEDAIPGVTLTLNKPNDVGVKTAVDVSVDKDGIKSKVEDFVDAYNDVVKFIADQSDADWGRDPGFSTTKRRLQSLLVTNVGGTGSLQNLAQLGITTERDGTLTLNSSKLTDAIDNDLDGLGKLFAGETGNDGIIEKFKTYIDGVVDSDNGLYASKKTTTDSSIRRLDRNIENMQTRLDKRESMLRKQFDALEQLMSTLNAQSSYMSQQMEAISKIGGS